VVVPALTTVHIGMRELGRIGAYKLLAQLNHEEVEELEIIPTSVIERGTTAKCG
jgi:DNA-binding LacI/PurR family transcriptional regulator